MKVNTIQRWIRYGIAIPLIALYAIMTSNNVALAGDTTIILDNKDIYLFYPSGENDDLPDYYKKMKDFPQTLGASVKQFTEASLSRDGISGTVSVNVGDGKVTVTITSDDPAAAGYATILPKIMSDNAAGQGLSGAKACYDKGKDCWDPDGGKISPWAFYLPLGLGMVNQKAVMLLNYPPSDALCAADYLSNFTMARWESVLKRVGISQAQVEQYESIVDVHPIAAPGSKQSGYIANTTGYFYEKGQPNYDQAMLDILLSPPGLSADRTPPLQVAGSDALKVWAQVIGWKYVKPGTVEILEREGQPSIPWVATNHPDVTSYQRCPGDPGKKKKVETAHMRRGSENEKYTDDALIKDELMDLNAACVLQKFADNPSISKDDAVSECAKIWCTDGADCNVQAVCIQARLDYDFYSEGNCKCEEAATNFCAAWNNNACPQTDKVTSCAEYNKVCGDKPKYQTCKSLAPS